MTRRLKLETELWKLGRDIKDSLRWGDGTAALWHFDYHLARIAGRGGDCSLETIERALSEGIRHAQWLRREAAKPMQAELCLMVPLAILAAPLILPIWIVHRFFTALANWMDREKIAAERAREIAALFEAKQRIAAILKSDERDTVRLLLEKHGLSAIASRHDDAAV